MMSRRRLLKSTTVGLVAGQLLAQKDAIPAGSGGPGRRILLKGGIVLSIDPKVGDFEKADVLIEGKKIAAVGSNLKASAAVIDATDRIVMPGRKHCDPPRQSAGGYRQHEIGRDRSEER